MKKISEIDAFALGRSPISEKEREKLQQNKLQMERENGYQKLLELCAIGEYEAARILTNNNPNWGYQIIDEEVVERED